MRERRLVVPPPTPCVGWDLNGVLADPAAALQAAVAARWGVTVVLPGKRYDEAACVLEEAGHDRSRVRQWLRQTVNDPWFIASLSPSEGALAAWQRAAAAGFENRVVTGHLMEPETVRATVGWLTEHGFAGRCDFVRERATWARQLRPALMVDDSPKGALQAAEAGCPVALVARPYNALVSHPLVERTTLAALFGQQTPERGGSSGGGPREEETA